MQAIQLTKYGLEGLEKTDIPVPEIKENQILVDERGTSINPFDKILISGDLKDKIPLALPYTVGGDFSGVVTKIGAKVQNIKVGDEVFGQAIVLNGGSGTFAEFCVANEDNTALKPKSISFTEAGALPLVGASAVQALVEHADLKPTQKILIHGGAGGIGHIAIQLAKSLGAYVATTVSFADTDFAKSLGADEVVDYKNQAFEDLLRDYDVVFDTVGGEVTTKSLKVLKKDGILVSMKGAPPSDILSNYHIKAVGQATNTTGQRLSVLAKQVESGKIKVHIAKTFSLTEIRSAFDFFHNGKFRGKIAVTIE